MCDKRTPLGQANTIPYSEVFSFHDAICTENSSLGPEGVSLIQMCLHLKVQFVLKTAVWDQRRGPFFTYLLSSHGCYSKVSQ
jgi:hypothetical protein